MAEEEVEATFRLGLPRDLRTDELIAWVSYRDVRLRVYWRAEKQQDLRNLLSSLDVDFWDQAYNEYRIALESQDIDGDLDELFGEAE